jgi:hypothetical protein
MGSKTDLVTILLLEENVGEGDFSRSGPSESISLERSLPLRDFLCLCFDLSRPVPEESERINDKDKDLRRDSQSLIE